MSQSASQSTATATGGSIGSGNAVNWTLLGIVLVIVTGGLFLLLRRKKKKG